MNIIKIFSLLTLIVVSMSLTSCRRNSGEVWDDTKTCSRHMMRGIRSLSGCHGESRSVYSKDEFSYYEDGNYQSSPQDYVPLPDQAEIEHLAMLQGQARQAHESPGDPGSSVPSIDEFRHPSALPQVGDNFHNIGFAYNNSLVKGDDNIQAVKKAAKYMLAHPNTYVFVEGHCDQRGAEAYNLSLGSRRSNAVRNMLVEEGVNPDNIFTISYGKEKLLVSENTESGWAKNRRAEFKIYQR